MRRLLHSSRRSDGSVPCTRISGSPIVRIGEAVATGGFTSSSCDGSTTTSVCHTRQAMSFDADSAANLSSSVEA